MQSYDSINRYTSNDAVTVLTVTVGFPPDMDENAKAFYYSLAEKFKDVAKERIYPLALTKYNQCTDRRKRYRYTPLRADFLVSEREKNSYRLTVSSGGEILIDEVHTWKGDGIAKRKRLKN